MSQREAARHFNISRDSVRKMLACQSAFKPDPLSASNIDPLFGEQARRCVVFI
jgi:ribosomal protein S24E